MRSVTFAIYMYFRIFTHSRSGRVLFSGAPHCGSNCPSCKTVQYTLNKDENVQIMGALTPAVPRIADFLARHLTCSPFCPCLKFLSLSFHASHISYRGSDTDLRPSTSKLVLAISIKQAIYSSTSGVQELFLLQIEDGIRDRRTVGRTHRRVAHAP